MRQLLLGILLFWGVNANLLAQGWVADDNNFETNWNVTFQVGRTALLNEVNIDFSGSSNDMNNMSDWGINLQIAKMVWDGLDIGLEFGVSNYKGFKDNSANVNWLMLHNDFNNENVDFKPYPIYYDSDLTNFTLFLKYNFINFSSWSKGYLKMNIYLKLGIGLAFPSSELGFKDFASYEFTGLTHPLYLKGRYPNTGKDTHNFFSPAFGLNYQLSERLFISAETSFQLIGADNLDGIHNYNRELNPDVPDNMTNEYRIRVYDMTAKFLFGLTYFFNFDTHKQKRREHMPWFSNRYRSYYSKFHQQSSKKERQERLPFYRDNFKDE